MKKIIVLALIVLGLPLIHSCNDLPTEIGKPLLPDTVSLAAISTRDTVLIPEAINYQGMFSLFNVGTILVGKYKSMTAIALSKFADVPDTLQSLTVDDIQSVQLSIVPRRYAIGDTMSEKFGFKIYRVNRRWVPDTTTYDSIMVSPKNYLDDQPIASFDSTITLQDTMKVITIELPKDLIVQWLNTDITGIYGLAIIPNEDCNVIHQFGAQGINAGDVYQQINVYYTTKENTTASFKMISGIDCSFVTGDVPNLQNHFVLQGALNWWVKLKFDVSPIQKIAGKFAGIHKAQLEFYLDSANSYWGNYGLPENIEIRRLPEGETNISNLVGSPYYAYKDSLSNKYIFPSITSVVQDWVNADGKGELILLPYNISSASGQLDRLSFYGLDAPQIEYRPYLRIFYSYIQEQKK